MSSHNRVTSALFGIITLTVEVRWFYVVAHLSVRMMAKDCRTMR